jgi:hypothetical protein
MGVHEAGHQGPAREVDYLSVASFQGEHFIVVADGGDRSILIHGDSLSDMELGIDRDDLGVVQDQCGGSDGAAAHEEREKKTRRHGGKPTLQPTKLSNSW